MMNFKKANSAGAELFPECKHPFRLSHNVYGLMNKS